MPEFDFCQISAAWVKECARCERKVIGTRDQAESEIIFARNFSRHHATTDGFNSTCKGCHRRFRGVMHDYDESKMFVEQKGKCALCQVNIFEFARYSGDALRSCLDHDHKTGKVRGLLCIGCNTLMGHIDRILDSNPQFDCDLIAAYAERGKKS